MCTMSNCAESEAHGTKNYWEKFDKLDWLIQTKIGTEKYTETETEIEKKE